MVNYRFILNNGTSNRLSHPIYKDDLSIEWTFESQKYFRRANLSGQLIYVGDDFDWIMAVSFEQKIMLTIQVDWNGTGSWQNYWQGSFHQTDCTINYDDKKISVKPNVEDRYTKILAGMEKEYDLIKLAPAVQPVNMTRRPMLQIYTKGEDVVSCFLSSMAWEQECEAVDNDNTLTNTYHFGPIGIYADFVMTNNITFSGTLYNHGAGTGEWNDYGNNGTYYFCYWQRVEYLSGDYYYYNGIRAYRMSDNALIWEFSQVVVTPEQNDAYLALPDTFTMQAKKAGFSNQNCTMTKSTIYGRWCVAAQLSGCLPIPTSDIVTYNRNYKYCKPYDGNNEIIEMSYEVSTTPTEWGMNDDGKYYVKPTGNNNYFPVARSRWGKSSLWYKQAYEERFIEESLRVPTRLRDAFTLEAVISVLLGQVDNSITFAATSAYSQFLFGTNPLLSDWGRLVISPKSNVLVAEYTQPSQKAPITLSEVLKMLRDAIGCYWFIDEQNRLRVEHVSWFKNGGSYTGIPSVGIDVTTMLNSRNGKPWSRGTNEISYEKLDMPERYEYSWMDDTTTQFKGYPVEVISSYVEQGKIEEITIAGFNSDIDYMMLNPSTVSEDGFALMCCKVENGQYNVPIAIVVDILNILQNYQLSMMMLQGYFLRSDLSSWHVKINQTTTIAWGIQRKKEQKIDIPLDVSEPNMQALVKTGIGNGEIKTMSINLSSRMAKTTLRYNTTEL